MIEPITSSAGIIIAIGGACAVVLGLIRWARPRVRSLRAKLAAANDAILGREAAYDSITGKLVQPALPGIGVRMSAQEDALFALTGIVERLVDTTDRLDDHEHRIKALEDSTSATVNVNVAPQPQP